MKATVEQLNPVQRRVSVEISKDEVNQAFESAYKRLQKKARIQGFRPGKAPLNVIRKLYGANVSSEVHENLVNQHLFSALNQEAIRPIASPMVESSQAPVMDKEFTFTAVVDVMPTIEIDDYKGVAVEVEKYSVKDETVQRELDLLRRRQAKVRATEGNEAAQAGMLAAISHTATHDNVDLPQMRVENMTVALGHEELFKGLEEHIIGMRVGESKDADVTLPADYGDTELASKTLRFHITLNDLKHLDVPEFNDEFAKDLDFENADALKGKIKEQLDERASDMSRQKLETGILDSIVDKHPFDVPPAMVDQVVDSMIDELPHPNQDERAKALRNEELRKNFRQTAKRRTQNTLVLWHVVQKEQLQVSDADVRDRLEQTIAYSGIKDPKQLGRLRQNLEPRIRENMIFEKAMNFLVDHAQVTEKPAEL